MHPYATARRSRRLSKQETDAYDEADWDAGYRVPDSPITSAPSPASSASSYSTASAPSRRRIKRDGTHVPRPPNAFMLYRSQFWKEQKATIAQRDHREISRMCGLQWKALSAEEQKHFKNLADAEKTRHKAKYPDYKYTPASRAAKTQKKKAPQGSQEEKARCASLAQMLMRGDDFTQGFEDFAEYTDARTLTPLHPQFERDITPSATPSAHPSPPLHEPQLVSSPESFIPTASIPALQLSPSLLAEQHAFAQHAPMLTSGFNPLLSQMYTPEPEPSYYWYASHGEYSRPAAQESPEMGYSYQPTTPTDSYPHQESYPQQAAPMPYGGQTYATDSYDVGGTYAPYGSWPYESSTSGLSYDYNAPVDPNAGTAPMFPFGYSQTPLKSEDY